MVVSIVYCVWQGAYIYIVFYAKMFLLSFFLALWTISGGSVFVAMWLTDVLVGRFVLKRASLVVAGAGLHHDPSSLRRVDVTQEMRDLGRCMTRLQLMQYLCDKALRGDLREALDTCREISIERSRVRRTPMCFLDVEYTIRQLFHKPMQVHRCLYPIYSFSDYVQYPPSLPCSPWGHSPMLRGMDSAILTLRSAQNNGRSVHLSCHVTSRLRKLEGPFGDFHCESTAGYQLRKHILRVVLNPEISELMKAVDEDSSSSGSESTTDADVDASTNSLKSLSQHPSVSVRLQVKLAAQRTEVMVL